MPNIMTSLDVWNNQSPDNIDVEFPVTPEDCEDACRINPACVQYMYNNQTCKTSNVVRLGEVDKSQNFTSGWLVDRIEKFKQKLGDCEEDWIVE